MFKPKSTRVLVLGYPYFVERLKELGSRSQYTFQSLPNGFFRRLITLYRTHLIYQIGGDLRPNRFHYLVRGFRKKLIIHWVGSDILQMKQLKDEGCKFSRFLTHKAVHWVEVAWTAKELAELGIKGQVIPLTPANFPEEVKEFPKKLVALTYLPTGKSDFYGESDIISLAKEFPEVAFLVAAASTTERNPEWPTNMIPLGWINNLAEIYHEVALLIRLPKHDGVSFMVLEALANGRHVIWNYPFTGVQYTQNYVQTSRILHELYQAHEEGCLKINQTGRDFVSEHYSPTIVWERIRQGIEEVLES